MTLTAQEIRDQYRWQAVAWAMATDDPRKANRLFKLHHPFYKEVRGLPGSSEALTPLLQDDVRAVRLLVATHLLPYQPERAQQVLAELENGNDLYAMDAKYTLISFKAGKLDLDW